MIKLIILAAGKGSRMNSSIPKVLHKVYDKTIIEILLDKVKEITPDILVIVGYKQKEVEEVLIKYDNVTPILQKEQLGTAHAIMQAKDIINDDDIVIIINADTPMIKEETLRNLIQLIQTQNYQGIVLSTMFEDKSLPYGRIIKENDKFLEIIESKHCSKEELKIEEVNAGLYCFKGAELKQSLMQIKENAQENKEMYLTDIVYYMNQNNKNVLAYLDKDYHQFQGINTQDDLEVVTQYYLNNNRKKFIGKNINFIDIKNTYIGQDVCISSGVTIYPNTNLMNATILDRNVIIRENSTIIDSYIGCNTIIEQSKIEKSFIGNNCIIGPFSNIRELSNINDNVKIGSFVEVKMTNIDTNTKLPHLSYVGDTTIGKNVNIGAGVITANMNINHKKNNTIIEDNVFIGSNSVLIAPVKIEEKSIIAASSTISKDIEKNKLAITRANLEIKNNNKC